MVGIAKTSTLVWTLNAVLASLMGLLLVVNSILHEPKEEYTLPQQHTTQVVANIDGNHYPLQYSEQDLFFMTQALYFEARSEPLRCQQMVASVIMTRMYDWHYPNTIQDVIWQPKQFSYTHDGKTEHMSKYMEVLVAEEVAHEALAGLVLDTTEGSLYYHNPKLVDWEYKDDYTFVTSCGDHDFYKRKGVAGWK